MCIFNIFSPWWMIASRVFVCLFVFPSKTFFSPTKIFVSLSLAYLQLWKQKKTYLSLAGRGLAQLLKTWQVFVASFTDASRQFQACLLLQSRKMKSKPKREFFQVCSRIIRAECSSAAWVTAVRPLSSSLKFFAHLHRVQHDGQGKMQTLLQQSSLHQGLSWFFQAAEKLSIYYCWSPSHNTA